MWFRRRAEPEVKWEPYELAPGETVTDEVGRTVVGAKAVPPVMRRMVDGAWRYRRMTYDEVRSYCL